VRIYSRYFPHICFAQSSASTAHKPLGFDACATKPPAAHSAPSQPANVFRSGGGNIGAQTSAGIADQLIAACASIKGVYEGSVMHSADAIAERCVPDPVRTKAYVRPFPHCVFVTLRSRYGALQMNAEAGWSFAFDDETPASFISRCPPSQGGGVWISMTHRPHWTACERYHRSRAGAEPPRGDRDECMAVISRDWSKCSEKNQISLVNILGQHGYGCGKVRAHMRHINWHMHVPS
jgi:hypothetical protein